MGVVLGGKPVGSSEIDCAVRRGNGIGQRPEAKRQAEGDRRRNGEGSQFRGNVHDLDSLRLLQRDDRRRVALGLDRSDHLDRRRPGNGTGTRPGDE
ncbi:MAG: hypothetical protein ACT4P1_16930 [Sporichthyaceae bacterium]